MCPTGTSLGFDTNSGSSSSSSSNLRSAFDVLDADRDGKISRADLRKFYEGFWGGGAAASDEDVIGSMMSVADANEDGYVEYDEFENVLRGRRKERNGGGGGGGGQRAVMEEVFRVIDRDGDGRVGREDLRSYLKWAGFDATDEDITAMIRLGGADDNQGVTFDGLLKILAL